MVFFLQSSIPGYFGIGSIESYSSKAYQLLIVFGLTAYFFRVLLENKIRLLVVDKYLFLLIVFFLLSGLSSTYYSPLRMFVGTFDIVKYLSLILVLRAVAIEEEVVEKIINIFTSIMVFAVYVAIIQQLLAQLNIYQITPTIKGFIYETPSIFGHTGFGMLCGLLFAVLFYKPDKSSYEKRAMLLAALGVVLTTSRMAYLFLITFFVINFLRAGKIKSMLAPVIIGIVLVVFVGFWKNFYDEAHYMSSNPDQLLRTYSMDRGIAIARDHPLLGTGPGTYGAVVSFLTKSPVYGDYMFSKKWYAFCSKFNSIDNFIPQLIAEGGAIGAFLFFLFWLKTSKYLALQTNRFSWFGKALSVSLICIIPMFFGSGLNLQIVTFFLWSLIGVYISYSRMANNRLKQVLITA